MSIFQIKGKRHILLLIILATQNCFAQESDSKEDGENCW
jgi:hypothetical protein